MNYTYWVEQIEQKLKDNEGSGIVGVFDSGIGGLTALPFILKHNPYKVLYIGDTAHFPYGEKDEELIKFLVLSRVSELVNMGAEVIGIACNTASIAFSKIKKSSYVNKKIIGTVECTSKYIAKLNSKNVGVIGTHYTVATNAYKKEINKWNRPQKEVSVLESAEQLLVVSVEKADSKVISKEVNRICEYFGNKSIDTFVLGCTHYAHIQGNFRKAFLEKVKIINPSEILAQEIANSLQGGALSPQIEIYFTGEKPSIGGLFKKYEPYIHASRANLLPFSQIGQYTALKTRTKKPTYS